MTFTNPALNHLKRIEPPALLTRRISLDRDITRNLRVNSHIHLPPNFSAFDSISQAVNIAARQSISVLGVSNYYDYSIYAEFAEKAEANGIFPLFGIEVIALLNDLQKDGIKLNDPGNPGKMYLCGKGITKFNPLSPVALSLLEVIRANDSLRMEKIIRKLAELFTAAGLNTGLTADIVTEQIVERYGCPKETVFLQERHAGLAFQEALFSIFKASDRTEYLNRLFGTSCKTDVENPSSVQNDIRSFLMKAGKPGYIEETFVGFEHAYNLALAFGGIPCYPVLADGAAPICKFEEEPEQLAQRLNQRGIYAAEFIPLRNTSEILSRYVLALRRKGIIVTAGTEHNTLDMLPLEPACMQNETIPEEIKEIFREGACVAAAHQYLAAWNEEGYVDGEGKLNSSFHHNEERIRWFRALGAELILMSN